MAFTRTRVGFVAALVLASSFFLGTANAQDGAIGLEEIVVTARKVEERLQDVPLAITAFSAAEIQAAGIENLDDVANLTPGMTFSNLIGEFLPVPVIRGIAPTAVQDRENNAAIFVDGVYVSGRQGLNFSQLDLERIEVVKGPQAAMYGRNSFSGAVNFVTAKPTDEFRGKAELTLGDRGRLVASGAISGPLVEDKLRARVAIIMNQWDGSYENQVADGPDIGGFEYETLQASLYWTPTDRFEAGLSYYTSKDQIDVSALTSVTANCENVAGRGVRLANFCGEMPSVGKNGLYVVKGADGEERDVDHAYLSLKLDSDIGQFTAPVRFLQGGADLPLRRLARQSEHHLCLSVFDFSVSPRLRAGIFRGRIAADWRAGFHRGVQPGAALQQPRRPVLALHAGGLLLQCRDQGPQ